MKSDPSGVVRVLWASVAAMLVGLVGLVAFVHTASLRIDATNRLIAEDAAPSLVALQSTDMHLSRLNGLLRERLRGYGSSLPAPAAIDVERALLDESAGWYFSLPADPLEAEVIANLRRLVSDVDDVTARVVALPPDAPAAVRERLRAELDARVILLDEELLRASHINADMSSEASQELRTVGRQLLPGALALEAISTLAAVVAILAAYRMSKREAALAERRILQQKNAELEAFSARVAHDLLSPLMTVGLALGLAEQRLSAPEDGRLKSTLARASSSLQRVRQMVSDLLDFARAAATPPPGARTEVAPLLCGLVGDLSPVASEAGVDLRQESAPGLVVPCAAGILSSMLSNLVQNAVRHARGADEAHVVVRAMDAGLEVRFEVEDSGPGVPLQDREAIFEPYVSRSDAGSGLGLGLATVKRLVESHGGHVGVSSCDGRGAVFWVTLPALRA